MPQTTDEAASVSTVADIKPRSRDVTDGLEKAAARGMLRAVGMDDEDFAKPQIGVASSWNEITPCNLSLDRLANAVKEGVFSAGGYPLEFGTISVSDGISMGHEGMHFSLVSREVIADSVEVVMQAERLDGSVLLAGCDKSLPGMLMAAARLDLAAVFLYAGSILPGRAKLSDGSERDVTIIDAFEAVGACSRGLMSRADVDAIERAICPGEGACGGMYTANTMGSREWATDDQRQTGSDVDRRRGAPGVTGRHQPGGDRRDDRPQQAMGDRAEHPPGGQHREVGRQRRDELRDGQADQADHQGPAARPVCGPTHQRNRCHGRDKGIPGQQGPN